MKSIFILYFLFLIPTVFAFKVAPMSQTIGDRGQQSKSLYYIENDSPYPIAIEIKVKRRDMDKDGKEVRKSAGNDIFIFPDQLIVRPSEKKSVRVHYKGGPTSNSEKAYRVIFSQLPIETEGEKKKGSSIKVNLNYVTALYVSQKNYKDEVILGRATIEGKKLVIPIINKGKRHRVLKNTSIKLTWGEGSSLKLNTKEQLKGLEGANLLALKTRIFKITKPKEMKNIKGPILGEITFQN